MKTLLATMCIAACFGAAFSQNVVPDNGFVGLGTTTPGEQLQVKGNVKIDSLLTVLGGLNAEGKAILEGVKVNRELTVDGMVVLQDTLITNSLIESNGTFIGNGKNDFNDQATFNGAVMMNAVNQTTDPYNSSILFLHPAGDVQRVFVPDFITGFANAVYSLNCLADTLGNVLNPHFQADTNEVYLLCADLGIGTSEPRVPLDVNGRGYVTHLGIGAVNPLTMTGSFHLKAGSLDSTSAAPIFVVENDQRRLLEINNQGLLKTREVLIPKVADWPDYVFEPGYVLMPLSEVEKYIQAQGHLPNVPSAASVAQEGIQVGEMNRILVEKVEELMLHLIEQEKRSKALEEQNRAQDAVILELQQKLSTVK